FFFPKHVLRTDPDIAAACSLNGGGNRRIWRRNHNVAMRCGADQRGEICEKRACFRLGLVHLPIASDYSASFHSAPMQSAEILGLSLTLVRQGFYAGQLASAQKFQRSSATGRNVRYLIRQSSLMDRC